MPDLKILSGGAARAVVQGLEPALRARTGCAVDGRFGAVGGMRDALIAGTACDVVILTAKLIADLADSGHVARDTIVPLGAVPTGVAVPEGEALPAIGDADALRASLRAAAGVYFPDPQLATAGIHFAGVLDRLGIAGELADRLHVFPNGATAMGAMADAARAGRRGLIGCTQVTEILYTPGVRLVGDLPDPYKLEAVYVAAVSASATQADAARTLVAMLGGAESQALRRDGGFLV